MLKSVTGGCVKHTRKFLRSQAMLMCGFVITHLQDNIVTREVTYFHLHQSFHTDPVGPFRRAKQHLGVYNYRLGR